MGTGVFKEGQNQESIRVSSQQLEEDLSLRARLGLQLWLDTHPESQTIARQAIFLGVAECPWQEMWPGFFP